MKELKAGLCIEITSWENDADDYRTIQIDGLTLADVKFYTELCSYFKSCHSGPRPGLGNQDGIDDNTLIEIITDALKNHPDISSNIKTSWAECLAGDTDPYEQFLKILHSPVQYDYGFCRVIEYIEVYDILVEQVSVKMTELSVRI